MREKLPFRHPILWLLLVGCASLTVASPNHHADYFPPESGLSSAQARRYAEFLIALGEPPMRLVPGDESYRFLRAPSLGLPIQLVRLTRMGRTIRYRTATYLPGDWRLSRTRTDLDKWTIFRRGRLVGDRSGTVNAGDWAQLQALLVKATYWDLPTEPPKSRFFVLNGEDWVIEARRAEGYRVVARTSPGPGLPHGTIRFPGVRILGEFLRWLARGAD